jgi:hypothetical protein
MPKSHNDNGTPEAQIHSVNPNGIAKWKKPLVYSKQLNGAYPLCLTPTRVHIHSNDSLSLMPVRELNISYAVGGALISTREHWRRGRDSLFD